MFMLIEMKQSWKLPRDNQGQTNSKSGSLICHFTRGRLSSTRGGSALEFSPQWHPYHGATTIHPLTTTIHLNWDCGRQRKPRRALQFCDIGSYRCGATSMFESIPDMARHTVTYHLLIEPPIDREITVTFLSKGGTSIHTYHPRVACHSRS